MDSTEQFDDDAVRRGEFDLGAELHAFRPYPRNVSGGYLTASLMVGCGLGLVFEMLRRWRLGASEFVVLAGVLAGAALFVIGNRVLTDVRSYDQLTLRLFELGIIVETASTSRTMPWNSVKRIDELTPLDPAVTAEAVSLRERPGDALVIYHHEGDWRFRLDPNRIADFSAMRSTLRDMADTHGVLWRCVHDFDDE